MEVSVTGSQGIPDGSILSIRAGQVRRQGNLAPNKPMHFEKGPMQASPFKIDVFAPIASSRLTLTPGGGNYAVSLKDGMLIDLMVKPTEANGNGHLGSNEDIRETQSRQSRRQKAALDTQAYIEEHQLVQFVQNLMQSVLAEKPMDPYKYMEESLCAARVKNAMPATPSYFNRQVSPGEGRQPHAYMVPSSIPTSPVRKAPQEPYQPPLSVTPGKSFEGPAFVIQDPNNKVVAYRPLKQEDVLPGKSETRRLPVPHLSQHFERRNVETTLATMTGTFKSKDDWIMKDGQGSRVFQMLSAGPHKEIHFIPKDITAAIVTCGGLCPGLNALVRELFMMLCSYGVKTVYGISGGFKGVLVPDNWLELTPNLVHSIHMQAGSILVSDRGNPPHDDMAKALMERNVRQYFIIGGDGTHRGALQTYEAMHEAGWECAVVGIPKTVDNNIPLLDKTFGFDTACTEARRVIDTAYTEATGNANSIGLVKLIGRDSGFVTMNACLAARNVDICLLPEMELDINKILQHTLEIMQAKANCVIVVAEGCCKSLMPERAASDIELDSGGQPKQPDVGVWLKDQLIRRFKEVRLPLTIKYIDPTYMIRAVPPNSYDSVYCTTLAQNAVHAAMAGYTAVSAGRVQDRYVWLPIQALIFQDKKRVELVGRWFARLRNTTGQPDFKPDVADRLDNRLDSKRDPLVGLSDRIEFAEVVKNDDEVRRVLCDQLADHYGKKEVPTTLGAGQVQTTKDFLGTDSFTTQTLGVYAGNVRLQMIRSGPREFLHFQPEEVAAAIVTCGGICPGLNSVIREIVMMLSTYGVKKVYGIKGGFHGVVKPSTWLTLTPESVRDIHMHGGSILVCDRGSPPVADMAAAMQKKGLRQLFVIGGDGTHKGAQDIQMQLLITGHECAVVCIPKALDNDINLIDRTFGFGTACTQAEQAIDTAYVEATCNANCIGLVKLMGTQCGYVAMHACLAARHVDICLIPEMDLDLGKVMEYAAKIVKMQGYLVMVIAEGCSRTLMGEAATGPGAGGPELKADVGTWLKGQLYAHFRERRMPIAIKYIDPTYMVRAVPANANDSIYCSILAHSAVHGAMAGYTGISVAKVDERFVYLPIKLLIGLPLRKVNLKGVWFERLMATTGQPSLGMVAQGVVSPVDPTKAKSRRIGRRSTVGNMMGIGVMDEVTTPETKLTVITGFGEMKNSRPLRRADLMQEIDEVRTLNCFHLRERFGEQMIVSPLKTKTMGRFMDHHSWSTQTITSNSSRVGRQVYYQMVLAGAREVLHFDPNDPAACAVLVSCGGICPGLNSVIREIVNTLWAYGVRKIYGVRGGYKGVVEPNRWIKLTPHTVRNIHMQGGTMLVSDRGNPKHADMAKVLKEKNVRQYFVLGGDGSHKGAMQTFECILEIDHECAVVGVPKTIDNDVPMLDQTFGFDTATTEAVKALESAYVEAISNANCIGLVKLMGRHCGHITLNAAIAAGHCDICLLPEMDIDVDKVLAHTVQCMKKKGNCVIVVAEGCGDTMIKNDTGETDAGGNKKLADVGSYFADCLKTHLKKEGLPFTIKFIDPTYMIRSVPANSYDSVYCSVLAQNAVHGAMAGFSGITVGKVHERYVYLPIYAITKQQGKRVDPQGRWFSRLVHSTGQPVLTVNSETSLVKYKSNEDDVMRELCTDASINNILQVGDEVKRLEVVTLSTKYTSAMVPNPLSESSGGELLAVGNSAFASTTMVQFNKRDDYGHQYFQMLRAGPREYLHFDPAKSAAAIVTCGGLCPGLNSVIREVVMMLKRYGVEKVYGCKGGYKGVTMTEQWIEMTIDMVKDIHTLGGTILVSDRGNPPHSEIAAALKSKNIKQYFVLGGDGTHLGIMQTFEAMQDISYECACIGIPKTIDNDIPMLDRTFGFNTACQYAQQAIDSAYTEASCNSNAVGLVKLMGRHCGFIALGASLAARHVDICLLPEMTVSLPKVLRHVMTVMKEKGHVVVVVAEGCGDTLLATSSSAEVDAGGHKKMADVGPWLQDQICKYFARMQERVSVKYIDPTYMVRAVPANANDNVYCTVLGQYAVHAAMAGYTGCTIGKVDERFVTLPIHAITKTNPPRRVDLRGRQFEQLMQTTRQPDLTPGPGDDWALLPQPPPPKYIEPEPVAPVDELDVIMWKGKTSARPTTAGAVAEEIEVANTKFKGFNGIGEVLVDQALRRDHVMQRLDEVRKLEVINLSEKYPSRNILSPLKSLVTTFQDEDAWALQAFSIRERADLSKSSAVYQMLRAGPREYLHFDPKDPDACAAIMTCGDLCPGLNAVVRELVMLLYTYGVTQVYGIKGGFSGIPSRETWVRLTPDDVREIHMEGGTVLVTDQGHPNPHRSARSLAENSVRQFFVIGGDGSHKGALDLCSLMLDMGHQCSVVCVPKTIDNNLPVMDKTFGFDTAISESRKAINAAYVEATCNANCIGMVKLIGKDSGFITMNAALSSRFVDLCLLPEMEIDPEKVLAHCEKIMSEKKYAVLVIGEGCFKDLQVDSGVWLKDKILARFKEIKRPLTIKYIDPTCMIRSVPPIANDSVYCSVLAEHAVHGAMAGYTGITVAKVYERFVYLPCHAITRLPNKKVNVHGRWVARLLATTNQPDFAPDGYEAPTVSSGSSLLKTISTPVPLNTVLNPGDEVHRYDLCNLAPSFPSRNCPNPTATTSDHSDPFIDAASWSTQTFRKANRSDTQGKVYLQMMRCGPREFLHFDPREPGVSAAIVTCGGICPGLNSVIRELVKQLQSYGVSTVYGIIGGYKGCVSPETWITLTEERVQDIHQQGGSILVSDRGNPPHIEIARSLQRQKVRWYFVLGGDGTHKGAMQTYDAMQELEVKHECAVVGIPKTIDNDIQLLDTSFGYDTACAEAERAIDSAYCEATTNANCIGLVKLMGRHCGFIATNATLAARHVDICLIPEMKVSKQKLLEYIVQVMQKKEYMVIVVAEGCGDTLIDSSTMGTDAGGNKLMADVGLYLRDEILSYCKSQSLPATIKYIDPTYMIRSVPANAYDSVYCSLLAQHAVHGAMAGYTGITVGKVDERYVMLPVHAIVGKGQRKVDVNGRMYERLMSTTQQPSFA